MIFYRYFGGYFSTHPTLFVTDVDLAKQMYVKDFEYFSDRVDILLSHSDPMFKKNLLAAKGKEWKQLRQTVSPAFTNVKMKNMFILIAETTKKFVRYFDDMNQDIMEVEMKETYCKFTNDVISSCAFGAQCDSFKNPDNEIYRLGKVVLSSTPFNPLWVMFVALFPKLNKVSSLRYLFDFYSTVFW